jgi:hypothetical protein
MATIGNPLMPWNAPKPTVTAPTTTYSITDKFGNSLDDVVKVTDTIRQDPNTGAWVNVTTGKTIIQGTKDTGTDTDNSGPGSGSSAPSATVRGWFEYYYGGTPSGLISQADKENWTEQDVINKSIADGRSSTGLNILRSVVQRSAAPYYGDDPGAVPTSLIDTLITQGYWTSDGQQYLTNTYFPALKGVGGTNPLASDWVADWVDMTGRPLSYTAQQKLSELVKTYGFTDVGRAAWQTWLKTTDSAITGNWGAEHRITIGNDIAQILGRPATEAELAPNSSFWNLNDAARLESIRATPEYKAIYEGKPAWASESDFISEARAIDAAYRWYLGDTVTLNSDGSLTFPHGPNYQAPTTGNVSTTPTVDPSTIASAPPTWKSLTNQQFATDLQGLGITNTGGKYFKGGTEISADSLLDYLPKDTYYKDAAGFHYIQEEGAVDKNGNAAAKTKPKAAVTPLSNSTTQSGGLNNWGMSYANNDIVGDAFANNWTAEQLIQEWKWQEEAAYNQGVYGSVVEEAFGGSGGIDWYKMTSGAKGSGAMRAQLVEAQNRVSYREAYRQVFGSDPSPSDYDRITSEFVSPGELIRETQAKNSADEMYPEVSDLMQRVYGETITVDELKDMALGRQGTGELKAMINQATKLDNYRWMHKQYFNADPTPTDYAKYAGYASPAELQWEILTNEKIKEFTPDINEAFTKAYGYTLTDAQIKTMLGEQEGYGDLNRLYKDAKETMADQEKARDWGFQAEQANINYGTAEQGGFKTTAPGLASL